MPVKTYLVKKCNVDFFKRILYRQSNIDICEASVNIIWISFDLGKNQFHVIVCLFSFWNVPDNIISIPVSLSTSTA